MTHEVVAHPDMPPALGPYSPVVRAGQLLFVSAQTGVDQATGTVAAGDFEAECRQAFANLALALSASGSDLEHIVKTTILYTDLEDLSTINKIYADVFPANPPARSAAVVGLASGRRISVDAIAVMPD